VYPILLETLQQRGSSRELVDPLKVNRHKFRCKNFIISILTNELFSLMFNQCRAVPCTGRIGNDKFFFDLVKSIRKGFTMSCFNRALNGRTVDALICWPMVPGSSPSLGKTATLKTVIQLQGL